MKKEKERKFNPSSRTDSEENLKPLDNLQEGDNCKANWPLFQKSDVILRKIAEDSRDVARTTLCWERKSHKKTIRFILWLGLVIGSIIGLFIGVII